MGLIPPPLAQTSLPTCVLEVILDVKMPAGTMERHVPAFLAPLLSTVIAVCFAPVWGLTILAALCIFSADPQVAVFVI